MGHRRLGHRPRLGVQLGRQRHTRTALRLWDSTVERSRARLDAALADGRLDQRVHLSMPDGRHLSLRRLLCDLIEEYGRHTGHADLLREAVDGRGGEDPPAGWHPESNRPRLSS
ncbi:MAG: DUF664 domain-containing protein [Nocardioidaceae bacterium]